MGGRIGFETYAASSLQGILRACRPSTTTHRADCESGRCNGNHSLPTRVALFISRHTPTDSQHKLAAQQGFTLAHVGDMNAFAVDLWGQIRDAAKRCNASAVVAVHPMIALKATTVYTPHHYEKGYSHPMDVLMFENINRAPEGQAPTFEAGALHVFVGSGVPATHPAYSGDINGEAAEADYAAEHA